MQDIRPCHHGQGQICTCSSFGSITNINGNQRIRCSETVYPTIAAKMNNEILAGARLGNIQYPSTWNSVKNGRNIKHNLPCGHGQKCSAPRTANRPLLAFVHRNDDASEPHMFARPNFNCLGEGWRTQQKGQHKHSEQRHHAASCLIAFKASSRSPKPGRICEGVF